MRMFSGFPYLFTKCFSTQMTLLSRNKRHALPMSLGRSWRTAPMMVLFSQGFRAFFDDVFGNVQFHGKVGVHALHLAGVHAPVTLPPFIQRGAAYAVHTRQFVDAFARLIAPKKPAGFFIIILKGWYC